jgi:hypothetical protein
MKRKIALAVSTCSMLALVTTWLILTPVTAQAYPSSCQTTCPNGLEIHVSGDDCVCVGGLGCQWTIYFEGYPPLEDSINC